MIYLFEKFFMHFENSPSYTSMLYVYLYGIFIKTESVHLVIRKHSCGEFMLSKNVSEIEYARK